MTTLSNTPSSHRPERRFSVDEYLRMVSAGILTKRDHVELINGRIVEKMPTDPPHVLALELVAEVLRKACPKEWIVRLDAPLQLEHSAPEPDAMVIRAPREQYAERHPRASDVLVIVEVADSTLVEDRTDMSELYAEAGIPLYWILNLRNRRLEVHSEPSGPDAFPTYRHKADIEETGMVTLQFPEGSRDFLVADMLPSKAAPPTRI